MDTTWRGLDAVGFVAPPQQSHHDACVGAPRPRRRSRRYLVPIQPIHSTTTLCHYAAMTLVFDVHLHIQPWEMLKPEVLALIDDDAHRGAKEVLASPENV